MITNHAIIRYLERVEGWRSKSAISGLEAERKRVAALILEPLVRQAISLREPCALKVVTKWGRVVVKEGLVVTIIPRRSSGLKFRKLRGVGRKPVERHNRNRKHQEAAE